MTETLQANIFFMIASAGVILLTLLTCIILYQVIRVMQLVRRIMERVELGSEVLADDIESLRENLSPTRLISFIMSMVPGAMPRRRRTRRSDD